MGCGCGQGGKNVYKPGASEPQKPATPVTGLPKVWPGRSVSVRGNGPPPR